MPDGFWLGGGRTVAPVGVASLGLGWRAYPKQKGYAMANLNPQEEQVPNHAHTGRPSAYTAHADDIDLIVLGCGAAGYSYAQIAACVGVSLSTLRNWSENHERFHSVLERAYTLSQAWWEGRAMDGTANSLIGGTVWAKSMSARFPAQYTERREHTSPDGSMSPHRELTPEELKAEIERRGLSLPDLT